MSQGGLLVLLLHETCENENKKSRKWVGVLEPAKAKAMKN